MDINCIKKLLKSNHIKFLSAIFVSILIHLFLFGGIKIYNPFFFKESDNLNTVIVSHLESPLKNDQSVPHKKSSPSKKSIKKNKEVDNSLIKKEDEKKNDLDNNLQGNDVTQISNGGEKKEIQYKKVIIDYDVRRGLDGSAIGAAKTIYLLDQDNRYSIRSEVEAKGFVSLFYWNKLVQTSDGLVTSEGLKPVNYHYQFGSKIDNSAVFDWESKKIITTMNGKTNEFEMLEASQDMLSFMYQFMFEPPLIKMKLYITNGKSYKPYDYAYIGDEIVETDIDKIETMHIAKFNYSNEERIDLWLAKDYRYLPVKIRKTEKDGSILDQSAKKIEIESLGL
jgi:hypothetical protein